MCRSYDNVLEIPFFSSISLQFLTFVHIYSILSLVSANVNVYFSLSAIRLRDTAIHNLLLQQTEYAPILDRCESFLICEKAWTTYSINMQFVKRT